MAVLQTEAVLVTKRRVFRRPSLTTNGEIITWKKQLTYLGVEIDKNLSLRGGNSKILKSNIHLVIPRFKDIMDIRKNGGHRLRNILKPNQFGGPPHEQN